MSGYAREEQMPFWDLHQRSRRRKWALFRDLMKPEPSDRVLDVGCGAGEFIDRYPYKGHIMAVDLSWEGLSELREHYPNAHYVVADGRTLPFKTDAFDVAYSNAVIEHVGDLEQQRRFGAEVARVAVNYFVTTPNKYFPLELHYRVPFFQFFPRWLQRWLNGHFDLGFVRKGYWVEVNLLSARLFAQVMPGAQVLRQRVTLCPETLIAYRKQGDPT